MKKMKLSEAITLLNITNYTIHNIKNISYNELKKHYHIQCLIYHPDKNITNEESTLIFQNINHAYNILKELIIVKEETINYDSINTNNANTNNANTDDYNYYILNFINFILNYYSNSTNTINIDISNIKHYANSHIKTVLANLLDNFSIVILEDLYIFLLKYKKECCSENDTNAISNNIITIMNYLVIY